MNIYWKEKGRLEKVAKVMRTIRSYPEAVKILKKEYNIITNTETLSAICRRYKIPRPLISANHGGDRRSGKKYK